jgi:O-antigen ligase
MLQALTSFLLFCTGLSLPFEWANVVVGGLIVTPSKVITGLLLAVALVRAALEPRPRSRDPKAIWMVLFGVSIVVSSTYAFFQGVPRFALVAGLMTWSSLIAFYFLTVFLIRTSRELTILLSAVALGSIAVTATGFLGLGFETTSEEGTRIGGQGGNSNLLAFNLVLAIPVILSLVYTARGLLQKVAFAAGTFFALMGIGGTLSRSALLAIPAMGLFWVARMRLGNLVKYAIPVALLVAAVILYMPAAVEERIATLSPTGARTDDSIVSRTHTNRLALQAFASSPLIGIGSSRFVSYAVEQGAAFVNVVHNAFLDIAAEEGLLGLVPFAAIHWLSWRDFSRATRAARKRRQEKSADGSLEIRAVLLQTAFVGCLLVSQFQPTQRYKGLWLLFALGTVMTRLVAASAVATPAQAAPLAPNEAAPARAAF